MKVALCLECPIWQFGGTEVLVRELIRGLAANHEIVLVSHDDSECVRKSSLGQFVKHHLRWDPAPALASIERTRQFARELVAHKVDLAHFHFGGNFMWHARDWRKCPVGYVNAAGVPCLSTNHGVFGVLEGYVGPQRSLFLKLALLPPAWFSKIVVLGGLKMEVAVSMADFRALRRRYWPVRSKFRQIYHSQIKTVTPVPAGGRSKTIICIGTIGLRKGQPYLIDAFARIASRFPDWNLVLIGRSGDDAMSRDIQQTIAARKLTERFQWLDRCSDEELQAWLRQAGIYAMPSLHEGLGLSLQEALAKGCPCVASRVGGIVDLVQDGDNGLLVEPRSAVQLASALEKLVTDAGLRARFSERGPKSIIEKEMTSPQMVEKYERLYREIVGS
jgi:glycosyltransferase involved in cell wall biosynthesis